MRDRGIDADHQIQRRDQCRGIGEIIEFLAPVDQHHAIGRLPRLRRGGTLLERNERGVAQGCERGERQRSPAVAQRGRAEGWPPSPDEATFGPEQRFETGAPAQDGGRIGAQIRHRSGVLRAIRREQPRQAHHNAFGVVRRCRITVGDDAFDVGQLPQQSLQRRRHAKDDPSPRCDQRNVTAELNGVAETLFRTHEQGLAGHWRAVPFDDWLAVDPVTRQSQTPTISSQPSRICPAVNSARPEL